MPNPPPVKVTFAGVDKITRQMNKIGAGLKKFGGGAMNVGRTLSTRLSLPLALVGGMAIKAGADFETSMLNVQALTNATGKQFQQMKDQAKELGATTMFTAGQAGDAMGFLAMAGFKTNEILAATPGVLKLAAAGNMELAETADLASNVLTAFRLPAEQMNRVNEALAFTAANSNTNIQQLGEAMKFAAPVARGLGISVEETAAAVGFLGNAGIQAEMAGTALRKAMISLADPTSEAVKILNKLKIRRSDLLDSEGRLKSFTGAIEHLEKAGATVQDTLKIMGIRAGPGMVALMGQGSKSLAEFNKEMGEQGAAALARLAEARMKGFNGAMRAMKSALESIAIAISESGVLDFLTEMAAKLTNVFREIAKTNPAILRIGFALAAAAAAIGPVLIIIGGLAKGLGLLAGAIKLVIIPFKLLSLLFTISPIGGLIVLIGLLTTGIILLIKHWDKIVAKFKAGFNIIKRVGGFIFGGKKEGEGITEGAPVGAAEAGKRVREIRKENVTKGQADVNINFKNLPPGTRVATETQGVNLNQDLGFARAQ